METTRTRALNAAVELVGTGGVRTLTHARIDARAGLPKGSTSNSFRTRAALLSGVVDHIIESELIPVGQAVEPSSIEQFVESMSAVIEYMTGPHRTMTTARLALFLEASHEPALQESLGRGRSAMESATVVALARLGVADPSTVAATLMACAEGLILHRIARRDDSDPRPVLARVLAGDAGGARIAPTASSVASTAGQGAPTASTRP